MSRLGTKTYSRKQECKTNLQFDQFLADKGPPKPSSAKMSVAAVHRWGMTSFTSLRKQKDNTSDDKYGKLEKTKNISNDPFSLDIGSSVNNISNVNKSISSNIDTSSKPKKFFKSGGNKNITKAPSPIKLEIKLPIVNNNHILSIKVPDYAISPPTYTFLDQKENSPSPPYNHSSASLNNMLNPSNVHNQHANDSTFDLLLSNEPHIAAFQNKSPLSSLPNNVDNGSPKETKVAFADHDHLNSFEIENESKEKKSSPPYVPDFDDTSLDIPSNETNNIFSREEPEIIDKEPEKIACVESFLHSPHSQKDEGPEPQVPEEKASEEPLSQIEEPQTQPKTKNIFRSKKIFNSTKEKRAIYKHRPWMAPDEEVKTEKKESHSLADEFEAEESAPPQNKVPKLVLRREVQPPTRAGQEPIISFKCTKDEKELFTVVKNVKQAYQCHESGETQEFNDDIEYLLESIQPANTPGTRALGILSFASKCMVPSFRIHLRAHGIIPKIFSALPDAPSNMILSLCTAGLMFVLSQDRLTMDLEASTLSLMLQLLESDKNSSNNQDIQKYYQKIYDLCQQMQQKGLAKQLNLQNINTANLAMEALLSLTSKRAGDWFKEELRDLGGLAHIVDTVGSCVREVIPDKLSSFINPSELQLEKLRKVDRCLRILESVSYKCPDNQDYLIKYNQSLLIYSSVRLLKVCKQTLSSNIIEDDIEFTKDSSLHVYLTCLLSLLKLYLILTHENEKASSLLGSQSGFMEVVLLCILQLPRHVSGEERRFDLLVLSLGLLINLAQNCEANREQLVLTRTLGSYDLPSDGNDLSAMEALVEVFLDRLESAKISEEQADAILSGPDEENGVKKGEDSQNDATASTSSLAMAPMVPNSQIENLEEILKKALQKAGKHMEHSIIGAYIALLLGCVIQNNDDYASLLRDHMPDASFSPMTDILKKFMNFVSLTGVVENSGVRSIQRIVEILEKN